MGINLNVTDLVVQLTVIGGLGFIALTVGPQLLGMAMSSLGAAMGQPTGTVSGDATAVISGSSATTDATMDPQLAAYLQMMGINPATYGSGGLGALNQGIPSALGSAWQNTGGIPGQIPGTTSPLYGTGVNYPQYTGATQFNATPLGSAQVTCPGGICRSYVGEVINV